MSNDALDSSLVAFLSMTQDDFDTSLSAGVYAGQPTVSFKGSQIFITIKNLSVIAVDDPATARMPSAESLIVLLQARTLAAPASLRLTISVRCRR